MQFDWQTITAMCVVMGAIIYLGKTFILRKPDQSPCGSCQKCDNSTEIYQIKT